MRSGAFLAFLIGVATLIAEAAQFAIVPLVPTFSERLSMSPLECGLAVGIPGASMALIGIPAGSLTERFGARRVTCAGVLLIATAVAQPLAPNFAVLVFVRLLCGASVALTWAGGAAWITDVLPSGQAQRALAQFVAWGAAGVASGPLLAGVMAPTLGTASPFIFTSVAALLIVPALMLQPGGWAEEGNSWAGMFGVARDGWRAGIGSAVCALFASAFLASALSVIVPLELNRQGLSESTVGLVFGLGAIIFSASSSVTGRYVARAARLGVLIVCICLLMICASPALVTTSAAVWIAVVVMTAPFRGVISALAFPLALRSGRPGVSTAAVMAVLLPIWSGSTVVGPLLAAAVYDLSGPKGAFIAVEAAVAIPLAWLVVRWRRPAEVCASQV
jgi:predicted MFS family arabinose efflux permease